MLTLYCIYNTDNSVRLHVLFKEQESTIIIDNDELLALSYDDFYSRMLSEVPHIAKHLLSSMPVHAITKKTCFLSIMYSNKATS